MYKDCIYKYTFIETKLFPLNYNGPLLMANADIYFLILLYTSIL